MVDTLLKSWPMISPVCNLAAKDNPLQLSKECVFVEFVAIVVVVVAEIGMMVVVVVVVHSLRVMMVVLKSKMRLGYWLLTMMMMKKWRLRKKMTK